MNVDRQRRLDGRREQARRQREAPASDDGQDAERLHAFQQNRPQQRPRIAIIARDHGRETKAVQRGEREQAGDQCKLDRQDDAVSGFDQRGKTFELDDGEHEACQREQRTIGPPQTKKS
jgi:hypothetical protein